MNVLLPIEESRASRWLLLAAIPILMAMGCKRVPYICPAYQSAFYLDENFQEASFSAFNEDSLPRIENVVKKNDVLLIASLSKKKKEKAWQTIPMITIFPQPDSALAKAALESGDEMREGKQDEESEEKEELDEDGNVKKKPKELSSDNFYDEEEDEDEDEENEEEPTIDELKDVPEEFPTEGKPVQEETDEAPEAEEDPADQPEPEVEPEEPEEVEPKEEPEEAQPKEETEEEEKEPNR